MEDAEGKHIVKIFMNDKPYELPAGMYTGAELKEKTGVPAGDLLYRIAGNSRHEIGDGQSIEIHEGEHFIAVPGHGGAGQ